MTPNEINLEKFVLIKNILIHGDTVMIAKPKSKSDQENSRSSSSAANKTKSEAPAMTSSDFDPAHFPRTAKGRRPYFFDDPNVDKLLAMITALAGEVSVLRERLDTHERLAAKMKWPNHANVENYVSSDEVNKSREEWRGQFISRIFRIVGEDVERMSSGETEQEYQSQIRHVST